MKIGIVTDSTCDLPQHIVSELGIQVVPLYINIGDRGYLDGVELSREEFYLNLGSYSSHPSTGTPGANAFINAYESLMDRGVNEILSIHISEALSNTINIARTAAREFSKIPVSVVDSQQLSMGTGFQVELAARMAKAGEPVERILESIQDLMSRTFTAAALSTLEYLKRSGRMSRFMTAIGSLLELKPILTMWQGKPRSVPVRTENKSQEKLLDMFISRLPVEKFAMLHSNALDKARGFRDSIIDHIPEGQDYIGIITPAIGSHIGDGVVGFSIVMRK